MHSIGITQLPVNTLKKMLGYNKLPVQHIALHRERHLPAILAN